ncbi:tetratricopeptide repeat protein [Paludisphaera mucosa]|uniref:Tetratricopeptide repeat protein n=1 Tax=Paludisphaera mucosa TaxID=3030827 RepID=A0ABT6FCN2_9BACT|nr:tetratricopeptide repeat protein [Paludisphaera mucosa]MDG3005316.1 tetratricopeptide repeat protein [Paludisphaera mucosa]
MRGGGGFSPGPAARPSFNRTPSFTTPGNIQRPNYGGAPGGWQGQMRPSTPAQRPNFPVAQPQPPVNRPNLGAGVNRPGPNGPVGGGMRPPGVGPGPGNPGVRPPIAGPGPGPGGRPPGVGPGGRPPGVGPGGRPPGMVGPGPGGRPPGVGPGGRPPGWGPGTNPPMWGGRPGWNNHQAWVNGYWHGRNNNWNNWNNGGAFWTGLAVGGIAGWGLNSAIYNWGYRPYMNPYGMVASQPVIIQQPIVVAGAVQPVQVAEAQPTYDYSQPLQASTPDAATPDPALQTFEEARAAFKAGDYAAALQKTDEALKAMPNDAAAHEFRALCLFALQQYDQAAGVLYAVLSVGPGWDWTTLIGLYPNVDVYSSQLRKLEDYRSAHPESAPARFVLAYHYLTEGFNDEAIREFKEVAKLQPGDTLSKQIVASLTSGGDQAAPAAAADAGQGQAPPIATPDTPATPAADEPSLVGTWKAAPDGTTAIELTIQADGGFTWNVTQQGRAQPITGKYTYGGGVLTMARAGAENDAMVGRVTWKDASNFVFQALGGGAGDPGLTFSKSQ